MRKLALSFAVLALVAAPAFAKGGKYNKVVGPGDKAPGFSGIPAVMGSNETTVNLDSIKEDVVVLVFLANHCPAVAATEDRIYDFTKEYQGKGVKVVGVSVDDRDQDRLPEIKERAKDNKFNYVYGYDESQQVGKAYGAVATPQFFVLDKDRVIRYTGAMDDSTMKESGVKKTYLKDAVDAVLAGKDVAEPETRAQGCGIPYKK